MFVRRVATLRRMAAKDPECAALQTYIINRYKKMHNKAIYVEGEDLFITPARKFECQDNKPAHEYAD